MLRIFVPVGLLFLALSAYAAFWIHTASEVRQGILSWMEEERAAGNIAQASALQLRGFPYRIEVRLIEPVYGVPAEDWQVAGGTLTAFAQPQDPRHLILRAGGLWRYEFVQEAGDTGEAGTPRIAYVEADRALSSLIFRDGDLAEFDLDIAGLRSWEFDQATAPLPSERGQVVKTASSQTEPAGPVDFRSEPPALAIEELSLHTRPFRGEEGAKPEDPPGFQVALRALNIERQTVALEVLSNRIDGLELVGHLRQVESLARFVPAVLEAREDTLRGWARKGGSVYFSHAALQWSDLTLTAQGDLGLTINGELNGSLMANATGLSGLVTTLVQNGVMDEKQAQTARRLLQVVSAFSGGQEDGVRLPIRLDRGDLYLGPGRVARLPRVF